LFSKFTRERDMAFEKVRVAILAGDRKRVSPIQRLQGAVGSSRDEYNRQTIFETCGPKSLLFHPLRT